MGGSSAHVLAAAGEQMRAQAQTAACVRALAESARAAGLDVDVTWHRGETPTATAAGPEPWGCRSWASLTPAKLLSTRAADVWAREFCTMFNDYRCTRVYGESNHIDVALMTSWFASAIESGHDRGVKTENARVVNLINSL